MSFLRFGNKSSKTVDISNPISESCHRNVHMTVDDDGFILGVPDEWKVLMKDVYAFNDLEPSNDNLVRVSNIVQTSLKRKKTINEGKMLKLVDIGEDDPDAFKMRESPGPRVDRKMKKKEVMKELGRLSKKSSPWIKDGGIYKRVM